jgi:hypothetical protein
LNGYYKQGVAMYAWELKFRTGLRPNRSLLLCNNGNCWNMQIQSVSHVMWIQKRHAYAYISVRFITPQETPVQTRENKSVPPSAKCVRCEFDTLGHTYVSYTAFHAFCLTQASLNFCMVRETSAKFGLHGGNMKFNVQNEEFICVFFCT